MWALAGEGRSVLGWLTSHQEDHRRI